ncbi:MAG: DegT/DnrJ/EryC1/StrS family aminotransferase [Anaerolineales bacterium]|nr:DegT/DnrJ/EryC1/StrS family aminotransferase [Anaerolineales bacterium]
MIPIARPLIGEDEQKAVMEVMASGHVAQGPKVREFESQFAELCGAEHGIATTSGTSALHVALLANEIGPGDEVITSPFSFIASANCALFVGAKPVFVDIEADYFTIDPEKIREKITPRTRAIEPVHLYGQACDMEAIEEIAHEFNLVIIEDACQAHGAKLNGRPVGSFGTACFSFYPTKNITSGEGGMITTNDGKVAEKARLLRDHGSPVRYQHEMLGYNLRMNDMQAAIGLTQLPKLEQWNKKRQENAAFLTRELSGVDGIVPPPVRDNAEHVFHQYTIRVPDRDAAAEKLREQGVGVGVHYPIPIHQQPYYQKLGYQDSLPVSEAASREVLSLPVHPSLSQADLETIVEVVSSL